MLFLLTQDCGAYCSQDNCDVVKRSRVVVISVKPHILPTVLKEVASHVTKDHLIVSIAAGVTIKTIEQVCARAVIPKLHDRMHEIFIPF